MSNTKIKAGQFSGIVGNGTDGYFLMTNGDGTMAWEAASTGPSVTSVTYPGDDLAADPAGGQTVVLTGTNFGSSMTVSIGGTTAPSVAHDSSTQLTITTPEKAAGDYDIVVTNTVTGASGTFVNGISYNGVPTWTTAAGSLGTFDSETTISTITLQATEPDGGTITFNITNGALPTGLSLTGANIDGTTTAESSTTLYSFTIEAIDDENQATPRNFSITVNSAEITPSENFTINTYTGNGSTQSIEGKIGTAASFNGSSSYISGFPALTNPTGNSFSVSLWVNTSSTDKTIFGGVVDEPVDFDSIFRIRVNSSGQAFTDYRPSQQSPISTVEINSSTSISDGNWHHIVSIVTDSQIKLYVDGSEESNSPQSITGTANVTNAVIGALNNRGTIQEYLNGKLDQVRIFNKALSSSEVTTLYGESNTSITKSTTDIFDDGSGVALYEFEEGAKDTGTTPYGTGAIDSGQSAVFNGSSSGITTTQSWGRTNDFSFSLWVKDAGGTHSASGDKAVLLNYNNDYIVLNYEVDNKAFSIPLHNGTTQLGICTTGNNFDTSTWRNIVVTNKLTGSGAGMYMYVDGTLVSSVVGEATQRRDVSAGSGTVFGFNTANTTNDLRYVGKLDQVRIYSSALSASDVEALVSETNVPTANLVAHYKLDGNANDETGSYNGTPTNITYSDPAEFPLIAYNGTPTNVNFLGMAFQPDLVWIKDRDTAYQHQAYDSVRGATKKILPSSTGEETTDSTGLTAFDSNGFTISTNVGINTNNNNYVAWCWKAGGASASNTDGSITSQVSANPDAGFSIVKYTGNGTAGATVGHGLSSKPELIIWKNTDATSNWLVYADDIATNHEWLYLNATNELQTSGSTNEYPTYKVRPTDALVTVNGAGSSNNINISGQDTIMYCFHSVDGYQKVGSYIGDGNTNGPTITLGFTPRFVMIKATENVSDWLMFDTVRDSVSPTTKILYANLSSAEQDGITDRSPDLYIEVTSNGFQIKGLNNDINVNGETFIYLAIA